MVTKKSLFQALLSQRIKQVPRSFIREILKVTESPDIISFAGGLPNKKYFPVHEINHAVNEVLNKSAASALQYSQSEGLYELRVRIAENYHKTGIAVDPENILITTGSQQALDLIGKVLIDKGDKVIVEQPAYLGAIQAFSMYQPSLFPITLGSHGIDLQLFKDSVKSGAKMAYLVTNFQNPTGITYSERSRIEIAEIISGSNTILIEDDPYGKIRFKGESLKSIYSYNQTNTILLGTFSKTVAPGLRIGWMVIPAMLFQQFVIAKQASDLHSDILAQYILNEFLQSNDLNIHIEKICLAYGKQADAMFWELQSKFSDEISFTRPEGGMFTWVTLPENISAMRFFNGAIKEHVAFVPGVPFYLGKDDCNTLRLNFSCSEPDEIKEGIARLAGVYEKIKLK